MADVRWKEEREEIIELVYRIQADHGGNLLEREAQKYGPWAADAIKRARKIRWLSSKGAPPVLSVTNKGSNALDSALASRGVLGSQWFGGSITSITSKYGPVLIPRSFETHEKTKRWAMEEGLVTEEDIERIASSERAEPQEPEEFRTLDEMSFPGTRWFAAARQYGEGHPFGGGLLKVGGYKGAYMVTATLTRRGAPDVPSVYMTDAYSLEGDSHLWLPERWRGEETAGRPSVVYTSTEGEETHFELVANRRGRLGQIRTVLRAHDAGGAWRTTHRLLNPLLCDLSYRYDVPVEVLQANVFELATLTLSGMKRDDFREKVFDPEGFLGSGLSYETLPNYEFFTRLYRESANSSSADYGFLCFFRIAEGVIQLRRKRIAEREGKPWRKVSRPEVFLGHEIAENDEENLFPPELLGKSLWEVYEELKSERVKVGHGFLDEEDPLLSYEDIIADRLEGEERAETRRIQARYLARRMLESEFFSE